MSCHVRASEVAHTRRKQTTESFEALVIKCRTAGGSVFNGWCAVVVINPGWSGLTFCGCGDGLGVGHGERDGSHSAVVWGGGQNWGEVAWDFSYHLTTTVRLQVGYRRQETTFHYHKYFISKKDLFCLDL